LRLSHPKKILCGDRSVPHSLLISLAGFIPFPEIAAVGFGESALA
jgi:hypothetical protein